MLVSEFEEYSLVEQKAGSLNPYFVGCWFLSSRRNLLRNTQASLNPYFVGCWFLSSLEEQKTSIEKLS